MPIDTSQKKGYILIMKKHNNPKGEFDELYLSLPGPRQIKHGHLIRTM